MLPTTGVANTSVGIPSAHTTVRVNKVLTPEGLLSNSTGRAFLMKIRVYRKDVLLAAAFSRLYHG